MESLKDIHPIAIAKLKKSFTLNPVPLKYPFPVASRKSTGPG